MDRQRIKDSGDSVRLSATSPLKLLITISQKMQVIPSNTAEEDRVPSDPRSTKGYCLEAGATPRKN
jgi:hypothetical protein